MDRRTGGRHSRWTKMNTPTLQLPEFAQRHAERLAAQDSVSADQSFATTDSEKLPVMEPVDSIAARAACANDAAFLEAASHTPDAPVREGWDQMP
jgi:hypothetical protein